MNKKRIAEKLNGINFPCDIPLDIIADLAVNNLVAVYRLDDDEVYLKGAISEKLNILDGESVYFDSNGIFLNKCEEDEDYPYFKEKIKTAIASIKSSDYEFETDIPHEEFKVYEAGEVHCVGIVFDMKDLSTTVDSAQKVKLALMMSKYIHDVCDSVPHDIGMILVNKIESFKQDN